VSIEAINWALNSVTNITSTQKAILLTLADRADVDGYCYPGYDDICKRSCATRHAVANALRRFEQLGLLKRRKRFNKSTVYQLITASAEINTNASAEINTASSVEINTLTTNEPSKEPPKRNSYKPPDSIDKDAWRDWVVYRRKFKGPTTERSLTLVANKLKDLTPGEQRTAVDMAIECGWKSVFPRKGSANQVGEFSL
jgi:DNA-binding MarR family transcriptional regulator